MRIKIIDNFLTPEECEEFKAYVLSKKRHQTVLKDKKFTQEFFERFRDKLSDYFKMYNEVTIGNSNKPIGKHIDTIVKGAEDSEWKLLIYLNDLTEGGGTFFDGFKTEHKKGRAIIFDIKLEHWGEEIFSKENKITIGFRLK